MRDNHGEGMLKDDAAVVQVLRKAGHEHIDEESHRLHVYIIVCNSIPPLEKKGHVRSDRWRIKNLQNLQYVSQFYGINLN
mgnify:CR=1 FL=1